MVLLLVGELFQSVPPAARTLTVIAAVYAIMVAAKQNAWVATHVSGWWGVLMNIVLTTCGLLLVVPAESLYSLNTLVSVVVGLLGSSGVHGMVKSVPPTAIGQPGKDG